VGSGGSFDVSINMMPFCYIWGRTNVKWKDANWMWSECQLVEEIIAMDSGVDAEMLIQPWQLEEPWNPYQTMSLDKKRRLIKLICKVKNKEYTDEKEAKDFPVTIGDIRMVVNAVGRIDLNVKLEE
jgi:hypothetical protein